MKEYIVKPYSEYLLNNRFLDKVCLRSKWLIRPELNARFQYHDVPDWQYIYSLDGVLVHPGLPPALNSPVPIYTPGWRHALCEG